VATAIGEKYQKIGEGFKFAGIELPTPPTPISWNNKSDMQCLPRISRTGFEAAIHYAVIVMKRSIYHDKKMTLSQKMLSATLWEHVGGNDRESVRQGDSRCLTKEDLKTIYAIEEVGEMTYSDKEISEKCKLS